MKTIRSPKIVRRINFWEGYEDKVPIEVKELVYSQYYSSETLNIYCDCSMLHQQSNMSIACAYLQNGSITVEQKLVYPPYDCLHKNIYAEIRAVIFCLTHFKKYMETHCEKVIIYSDVDDIEEFLCNSKTFKKNLSLKELQSEMIFFYQEVKKNNPDIPIEIRYLPLELRRYNPFAKSAHNAAKRMLRKNAIEGNPNVKGIREI